MRSRTPLFVLLASSLTFLASLFLPWRETTLPTLGAGVGAQGLLHQFSGSGREYDGWVTSAGDVAVLLVVALVLVTVAALRRPQLSARLPLGSLALALGYFAVALAVTVHRSAGSFSAGSRDIRRSPTQAGRTGPTSDLRAPESLCSAGSPIAEAISYSHGKPPTWWPVFSASLCSSRSCCRG
jgi:hypothetical protein